MESESIIYSGITYRRYPKVIDGRRAFTLFRNGTQRARGAKRLHQQIWIDCHGPIPEGCVIHHKDGNALNNDISNLVCIDRRKHQREHVNERLHDESYRNTNTDHLAKIRPLSHAWRQTEFGKRWHTEHAYRTLVLEPREFTCIECNTKATTRSILRAVSSVPPSVAIVGFHENIEKKDVISIAVKDEAEYYANGILVSNCHALLYAIVGLQRFGGDMVKIVGDSVFGDMPVARMGATEEITSFVPPEAFKTHRYEPGTQ